MLSWVIDQIVGESNYFFKDSLPTSQLSNLVVSLVYQMWPYYNRINKEVQNGTLSLTRKPIMIILVKNLVERLITVKSVLKKSLLKGQPVYKDTLLSPKLAYRP